jgi:hypothetical protein
MVFGAAQKPLRPFGRCLGLRELHRLSLSRNMDALLTACSNVPWSPANYSRSRAVLRLIEWIGKR